MRATRVGVTRAPYHDANLYGGLQSWLSRSVVQITPPPVHNSRLTFPCASRRCSTGFVLIEANREDDLPVRLALAERAAQLANALLVATHDTNHAAVKSAVGAAGIARSAV